MTNEEIMIVNNRLVPNPENYPLDEEFIKYCDRQIEELLMFKNSIDSIIKIVKFHSIDCNDKMSYAHNHKFVTKYEYVNVTILRLLAKKVKYLKSDVNLALEIANI
jgi:hypothetical protein